MSARSLTTLYRFYAADGVLLYVGIAADPGRRFTQHGRDKGWWTEVASARLEHFPGRPLALMAEAAAIRNESPRYNIAGRRSEPTAAESDDGPWMVGGWTFSPLEGGAVRRGVQLELAWDAECSSFVDDVLDPGDAFDQWAAHVRETGAVSGRGWVPIDWFVTCSDGHGIFEAAPFQQHPVGRQVIDGSDFLGVYTWPTDAGGCRLNFCRLPMRAVRPGFLTDATGFAPGPLQPALHLPTLVEMREAER